LDPQLDVGDIVVADAIGDPRGVYPTCRPRTHRPHSVGLVWSQDRVAVTVSDKKLLRQTGASAVEMEAAGLLERASNWGSDMYCIRAVSDRAGEDLPMDFNALRDANGRFNRARIVRGAIARPFARIPRLLRMRRNCTAAAERLGEFLADCRF
jgi:nucleoside phosphorylase